MTMTLAKNVTHYCRTCGYRADAQRGGQSAHSVVRKHYASAHPTLHQPVRQCPAGCGFKASYHEHQGGAMLYGAREVATHHESQS